MSKPNIPVPPRPYSEWLIYFQLERNYIHQKVLKVAPIHKKSFDPLDSTYLSLFSSETGRPLPIPHRYEGIDLPEKFYTAYKDGTSKVKHDDAIISLQDLSNMVSENWESADDETKEFVRVMHLAEMQEYKRRYTSCIVSREQAKNEKQGQILQNAVEQTNEEISASYDKGTDAREGATNLLELHTPHNGMSSSINNSESHALLTAERMNDSAGLELKKRIAATDIGTNVPIKKRPKLPFEQSQSYNMEANRDAAVPRSSDVSILSDSKQDGSPSRLQQCQLFNASMVDKQNTPFHGHQNNIQGCNQNIAKTNQDVAEVRSRIIKNMIKHSIRTGHQTNLQLSHLFSSPVSANHHKVLQQHYTADLGGTALPQLPQTYASLRNDMNHNKTYAMAPAGRQIPPIHPKTKKECLKDLNQSHNFSNGDNANFSKKMEATVRPRMLPPPGNLLNPLSIEQFANQGNVPSKKYGSHSYPSGGHRRVTETVENISLQPSRYSTNCSESSLSGIVKPHQQGGGSSKDAIKRVQDEMALTDWEVRLLLSRGAKSIAEDAARSISGDICRPCPAATKAAIKYLEGQTNRPSSPIIKDATHHTSAEESKMSSSMVNSSTQLEQQLSDETKSNIATVVDGPRGHGLTQLGRQHSIGARSSVATSVNGPKVHSAQLGQQRGFEARSNIGINKDDQRVDLSPPLSAASANDPTVPPTQLGHQHSVDCHSATAANNLKVPPTQPGRQLSIDPITSADVPTVHLTQLGRQLSVEARSNIATVAAAATAVGLRLLPPSEVDNSGSQEEVNSGQNDSPEIVQSKKSSGTPVSPPTSAGPISVVHSKVNNPCLDKESAGIDQDQKLLEALAPNWTSHDILLNAIRLDSSRYGASELRRQQSLLNDVMKKK